MSTTVVSPTIQRRITGTLFITQSIFSAALLETFILTTIVAAQLSGRESLAGIPGTLNLASRAFIGYPVAWLMERHGRRIGFVVGYLLAAIGAMISAYTIMRQSFWGFCIGSIFIGLGRGISEQTRYAAAEVYPQNQRGKVIGWIVSAGTVGSILGPLLVAPSSNWATGLHLNSEIGPFVLAALMSCVAVVLTFVGLRPDPLTISRQFGDGEPIKQISTSTRPMREIFANSRLRLALGAMVIGQFVMTFIMSITALHMEHYGHDLQHISWVLMAHTLGMFGLAIVTGWLVNQIGQVNMILIGGGVLAVSAILTPLSPQFMPLAFALFLLGLGWNFCFIAGSSLLTNTLTSHERTRGQGFGETFVAVASGTASLGSAMIFAYGGIMLVSLLGLAFTLIFMLGAFWSIQNYRLASAGQA